MRFKKGSKEAKAFMAKIRAKKGKKTVTKKPVKKIGATKKTATKKAVKKATPKNLHKDTHSHNVNIRVVSGFNAIDNLKRLHSEKEKMLNRILAMQKNLKETGDQQTKKHFIFWINRTKKYVKGLNMQIREVKKHI